MIWRQQDLLGKIGERSRAVEVEGLVPKAATEVAVEVPLVYEEMEGAVLLV